MNSVFAIKKLFLTDHTFLLLIEEKRTTMNFLTKLGASLITIAVLISCTLGVPNHTTDDIKHATYKVTFNKNHSDASGTMSELIVNYGAKEKLPACTMTRVDYVFSGWATSPEGDVAYPNQAELTMGDADIELFAKWVNGKTKGIVTHFAGSIGGAGDIDGTGSAARFSSPGGMTTDGLNIYITDGNAIRKLVIATGEVTTIAGLAFVFGSIDGTGSAARFKFPKGITCDGQNLYVTDNGNHTIRKIVIATGEVTTLAGSWRGTIDGIGSAAQFYNPSGITCDGQSLYVTDSGNYTIRKLVIATGEVTTIAGLAGSDGSTDGTGSSARFYYPIGITTDGTNLYVADTGSHTIRKIVIATGVVTTIAGLAGSGGSTDGTGNATRFVSPRGITTDGTNLYVADTSNHTIRKIVITTGEVTTIAGLAGYFNSTDGTGNAARFFSPEGITTDGINLYVAEKWNDTIRMIGITTGEVTTIAGLTGSYGSTDGTGSAARFDTPIGIACDGQNLYVADTSNRTIRKLVIATGEVTTLAGDGYDSGFNDGIGSAARFNSPKGITIDGINLYITDQYTIRKLVIATGEVTTLAGLAYNTGSTDGIGSVARFSSPDGISTDGTNLYVAESNNHTIRKIVIATGEVTTIAGLAGSDGSTDGTGSSARFYYPTGITCDGQNLFITDSRNHTIRMIVISTGEVTTIAGLAGSEGSTDGRGSSARFHYPSGITCDGQNLFITDSWNDTIRMIVISTGEVTTIAGSAHSFGSTDGIGSAARFNSPEGIVYTDNAFYVVDTGNHCIRKIE